MSRRKVYHITPADEEEESPANMQRNRRNLANMGYGQSKLFEFKKL